MVGAQPFLVKILHLQVMRPQLSEKIIEQLVNIQLFSDLIAVQLVYVTLLMVAEVLQIVQLSLYLSEKGVYLLVIIHWQSVIMQMQQIHIVLHLGIMFPLLPHQVRIIHSSRILLLCSKDT